MATKRRTDAAQYDKQRKRSATKRRTESAAGRDIGVIPPVKNPPRRRKAGKSFRFFCETYDPDTFGLKWSPDHLRVINRIEDAVLRGGLFAMAMPRGNGKTSLTIAAAMWAVLYGRHSFVCLIGSDEGAASMMLESIKTELETNNLIAEDFPRVCYPIAKLERVHQRKITYRGKPARSQKRLSLAERRALKR